MIPFVLGSASVLSPPQFGVPLAVASLGARGIQASIQNRKRRNASESGSPRGWQELGVGWNKESHGQVCWSRRTSRMTWGHACLCVLGELRLCKRRKYPPNTHNKHACRWPSHGAT